MKVQVIYIHHRILRLEAVAVTRLEHQTGYLYVDLQQWLSLGKDQQQHAD